MTRIVAVIPARMGSSRFPGKPLATIHGKPMIEHVFRGTRECEWLDDVLVATCDGAIADAAVAFGGQPVMTSPAHERATDRVAEAVAGRHADIVVMVQGDEPMVRGEMIRQAIAPLLSHADVGCVNLAAQIDSAEEVHDPNTIKVVANMAGDALYFSRQPIPHVGAGAGQLHRKQVCVIAFRRSALERFSSLRQGELEKAESIDMLRFLEHGVPVRIEPTLFATHAVDTPLDLVRVAAAMKQ